MNFKDPKKLAKRVSAKTVQMGGDPLADAGDEDIAGGIQPPEPAPGAAQYLPVDNSAEKPWPNDIARKIMAERLFLRDKSGLLYEYTGSYWDRIPDSKLDSYALSYDTHRYTKRARRREAANYILDAVLMPDIPWRRLDPAEVPVKNGVVDVVSCEVRAHRPEDYLETVVPFDYDPQARCPVWLKSLDRWFQGDKDAESKVAAIQEFFGYTLLPHARYKRAMFLHGESDTGKSQVALVLGELVGARNRCTLSTEHMADERKRSPIVGKMLNILTELPAESLIADGGFKQLVSTGDPILIDPKYKDPFEYSPFCKHLICTNTLPQISDLSRATFNRLLLIQFSNVIPVAEQDKSLLDRIRGELAGVLAWSIEGAARLIQQNGEFTSIEESVQAVREYRADQNPVNEFIQEQCEVRPESGIPMTDLRERFNRWFGRQLTPQRLGRYMKSAGYSIVVERDDAGRSVRVARGLAWARPSF